jgi:hypothetical protein
VTDEAGSVEGRIGGPKARLQAQASANESGARGGEGARLARLGVSVASVPGGGTAVAFAVPENPAQAAWVERVAVGFLRRLHARHERAPLMRATASTVVLVPPRASARRREASARAAALGSHRPLGDKPRRSDDDDEAEPPDVARPGRASRRGGVR